MEELKINLSWLFFSILILCFSFFQDANAPPRLPRVPATAELTASAATTRNPPAAAPSKLPREDLERTAIPYLRTDFFNFSHTKKQCFSHFPTYTMSN